MSGASRGDPRAVLAIGIAVFAVSWAAILVRLCDAPSLTIAFWRLAFASLLVAPWAVPRRGPVTGRTAWLAIGAGVLLAAHFATWISSLAFTSVASSVVLVATQPVFTAALGPVLLGEHPGPRAWIAVGLAFGGAVVLAGGEFEVGGTAWIGDLLALCGALTASLYFMVGRRLRFRIGFARYLFSVYAAAVVVLASMVWVSGAPFVGFPSSDWLWLALMAIGPNLVGHGLLNWSVRRVRALTVNVAILGEPLLATAFAAWLFDERPSVTFYLGAILIGAGIVVVALDERGRRKLAVDRPDPGDGERSWAHPPSDRRS